MSYESSSCCVYIPKEQEDDIGRSCDDILKEQGLTRVEILGQGGFGVVYLYEDEDQQKYAVKYRTIDNITEDLKNIYNEPEITCICRNYLCRHSDCAQTIANVYDAFICNEGTEVATVTEYIPGSFDQHLILMYSTLAPYEILFTRPNFPASRRYILEVQLIQIRGYLYQLTKTLSLLQNMAQFTHYDLKPDNIRLQNRLYDKQCSLQYPFTFSDTSGYVTSIIDFGLARVKQNVLSAPSGETILSGDNVFRAFQPYHDLRFLGIHIIRSLPFMFRENVINNDISDFKDFVTEMVYPLTVTEIIKKDHEILRKESETIWEGTEPYKLLKHNFFNLYS